VNIDDLKNVYNAKFHPEFLNGNLTEDECLHMFLDNFEMDKQRDGVVHYDEFVNYYTGVSSNIDDDVYFMTMMVKCWNL
jgi:hypothetical protein